MDTKERIQKLLQAIALLKELELPSSSYYDLIRELGNLNLQLYEENKEAEIA